MFFAGKRCFATLEHCVLNSHAGAWELCMREALASRDRTGSWSFQDCIPKQELGNERRHAQRTLQFFVLFVFFKGKEEDKNKTKYKLYKRI